MSFFRRKSLPPPIDVSAVKIEPAPTPVARVELSDSSQQVMMAYDNLPEENRPAYDVRAILEALDFKYGHEASSHLRIHVWDGPDRWASLGACDCIVDYDEDGWPEYRGDSDGLTGRACPMPEYLEIYEALCEIQHALNEREAAVQAQVRAAELAGIDYELRSVADLTAALRKESHLIREVTEEIFVPLSLAKAGV